jgi:hypothetical protein
LTRGQFPSGLGDWPRRVFRVLLAVRKAAQREKFAGPTVSTGAATEGRLESAGLASLARQR